MLAKTKGAAAKAPRSADKPNNGNLFDIARVLISSGIKTEPQDTVVAMSTPTPLRKRMLLPGEFPDVEAAPCTSAKRVRGKRIMSGSPDIEAQDVPAPKVTAPQAAAPEVTAPQAAAPQVATSDAPAPSARAKQESHSSDRENVGTDSVLANGPASLLSGLMSEMGGSPASTEEADFLRRLEVAMLAKAREEIMHLQKRQANEVPATAAAGRNPATRATPGTEAAAEAAAPATPSSAAPMLDETAETSASAPMAEAMGRFLGADTVHASGPHSRNGRLNGSEKGWKVPRNKGKIPIVKKDAEDNGHDLSKCWAYGNSHADFHFMDICGNAMAVNPDSGLSKRADQEGWEKVSWKISPLQ